MILGILSNGFYFYFYFYSFFKSLRFAHIRARLQVLEYGGRLFCSFTHSGAKLSTSTQNADGSGYHTSCQQPPTSEKEHISLVRKKKKTFIQQDDS